MKVKVKKPKKETCRILIERGVNDQSGIKIDGKFYEYGKEYTVSKEFYKLHEDVFTHIKEKKDE